LKWRSGVSQTSKCVNANRFKEGFVHDCEHRNDVDPFWLSNELEDDAYVIEGPLSIGEAHGTVEEVESLILASVSVTC